MSLRGIFDGGGVRKQNGHWQSSRKGMKSYIWNEDAIDAVLPIIKNVRWNPMQQLNVSGSFDLEVKTNFSSDTHGLFGISTNGRQVTQLSDTGFAYDQTIGARGFNRRETITHNLPLEPDDDYRQENYFINISLRGYSPTSSGSEVNKFISSYKTEYMVNNNIQPALRYHITYKKTLAWGKHDNDYGETIFSEEYDVLIPLTITTTQQPFNIPPYSRVYNPVGNIMCNSNNRASGHITYSFTIPAFDATTYPHIANDLLVGNEYDFIVCLATGYALATDDDWGTKVQLNVSNIT